MWSKGLFRMRPHPDETVPTGLPTHWPELDLLRSLAAAMMVLNHVAEVGIAVSGSWLISPIAFASSFAPVIFFFLTGLGYGVQSVGRPISHGHGYLLKVLILFAADSMLWAGPTSHLGLNFLGFIGLSMLVLEWVRRVPRSGLVAAGLAIVVVANRFLVGPLLRSWIEAQDSGWLAFVFGVSGVPGCSYPLGPWLAYPLLGYTLGRITAWRHNPTSAHRPVVLASLAALAGLTGWAAWLLAAGGAVFFRWGTMSFAYFVASAAAVAMALVLVLGVVQFRPFGSLVNWVMLSGIRSFAVVPLHYALLTQCNNWFGPVVGLGTFARNASVVLILSFAGSALVPRAAESLNTERLRALAWVVVLTTFVFAYSLLVGGKLGADPGQTVRMVTQLGLCVLLATTRPNVRASRRPSHASTKQPAGAAEPATA
jgi:uncharacterized membrane protein